MQNTEMIVLLNNGSGVSITDYYSKGFVQPTTTTGTELEVIQSQANASGIFATFSRPLSPASSMDLDIYPGLTSDFSFAYLNTSGKGFIQHNNAAFGLITFGSNNNTSKYIPGASNIPYFSLDANFYFGWTFSSTSITLIFNVPST
jgi:hypothetical protein